MAGIKDDKERKQALENKRIREEQERVDQDKHKEGKQ